jgi:MFS family permease
MNTTTEPSAGGISRGNEFRGRLLLILSAAIGLSASMNAVMLYSIGSFIGPLESEFGWARGDISLAATLLTFGLFLAGPIIGLACDRWGAAVVAALLLIMSNSLHSLAGLWTFYFVIALAGAGSTPIVLVRPISAAFDRQRGLALGISLTGAGLVGFWIPNLVTAVVAQSGWRTAYGVLALIALVAAPVVYFGFRATERGEAAKATATVVTAGLTMQAARKTAAFWSMSALSVTMALGIGGLMVHLVPMFRDLGAAPATAAGITSLIGIASVVGRLCIGLCLDRFSPHRVAVVVIGLGILGILVLKFGGLAFAIVGVVLIGLLLGAELDMLAFLTARLFGQRAFGAIYGWFYSVYALAFGISPVVIGRLRDSAGDYGLAMNTSIAMLLVAVAAAMVLGRWTPERDSAAVQQS